MPTSFTVDPSARAALSPEELRRAFTGAIERPRVRPLYLLGMTLVAGAMILLPILYLGIIAAIGYGLYEYAVFGIDALDRGMESRPASGRRSRANETVSGWAIILYLIPLIGGAFVIAFLLKPLFAPRPRRSEPFTLGRDSNPVLYGYVEMLCKLMHAPVPKRIDVDEFPNASASFRTPRGRGGGIFAQIAAWFWMLKGDVVLTIGMPLAAGMTASQLTGVLAHEFGHFTQRLAMRLGWIISNINSWLGRLAYERDAWDYRLDRWQHEAGASVFVLFVLFVRFMVWLTRLILKGLVLAAHAMSCFMSRQMEYDADEWQCRVIGSAEFPGMFDRIEILSGAANIVFGNMNDRWRERRMPDDLPLFIAETARTMPAALQQRILAAGRGEPDPANPEVKPAKRSLFDTHPTRVQRQAAALAHQAPGVFRLDAPATALFADFASLCKQLTFNHYKEVLGKGVEEATFIPTRELVSQNKAQSQAADALAEFFLQIPLAAQVRPRLTSIEKLVDAKATARELVEARKQMQRLLAPTLTDMQADAEAWHTELLAWRARYALSAGLKPTEEERKAGLRTADQAKAASRIAADAIDARIARPDPFRDAAERRISAALALYRHPDVARKIPTAETDLAHAEGMISAYSVLNLCRGAVRMISRESACGVRLIEHLQSNPKHQGAIEKLAFVCRELDSHVTSMRNTLSSEPYPFPHAAGQLTMAAFVVGVTPPADYLLDVVGHAHDCLERFGTTRQRALMPLIELTLRMEAALGLPPLKAETPPATAANPQSPVPA